MPRCVICLILTIEKCDRCKEFHCPKHECRLPQCADDIAILPILAYTARGARREGGGGSSETVSTVEVTRADDPKADEERKDYLQGAIALALLAAWIAYSTVSDRRKSGFAYEKAQAMQAFDELSGLLVPDGSAKLPESISVMHCRRRVFREGFKFGFIPTPMPFPAVFASAHDFKLAFHLGMFTYFANAKDVERFSEIVNAAGASRGLTGEEAEGIVDARNGMARAFGQGYGLGTATYSAAYKLVVSQVGIPFVAGVMNSSILSLQTPWDAAMNFNYVAIQVGKQARLLREMDAAQHARAMTHLNVTMRPIYRRMLAPAGAFAVGVGATSLLTRYFSRQANT